MDIFVFPDIVRGEVKDISFEMLGLARTLAHDTGGQVYTLVLGHNVEALLPLFGASDVVVKVDHERLEHFNPHRYRHTLLRVLNAYRPDLVLMGHTSLGMDLAGFLATRLDLPLLAFCTRLHREDGDIRATSLICGGKAYAVCRLNANQGIVLMSSGAYPADEGKGMGVPAVESLPYADVEENVTFEGYIEPAEEDLDITREERLVGIGRGMQEEDNLALAEELADALGAALCATRPVIESGWLPLTRQVGRSGKIVKPKLYLACGISGAPEHIEGMKDADLIIAINTDPDAPIFNVADYGIVEDVRDVLPALTEVLRRREGAMA